MTPDFQFADLVDNDFMNRKKIDSCFLLSYLLQLQRNILSHGHPIFDLGRLSVSGVDSPDARLIQASVGVHPLAGGCGTKLPP
jgi:hypothetical protein